MLLRVWCDVVCSSVTGTVASNNAATMLLRVWCDVAHSSAVANGNARVSNIASYAKQHCWSQQSWATIVAPCIYVDPNGRKYSNIISSCTQHRRQLKLATYCTRNFPVASHCLVYWPEEDSVAVVSKAKVMGDGQVGTEQEVGEEVLQGQGRCNW